MPDWFSSNAPKSDPAASSGGGWFDLYSPTRKPAAAEDFAPSKPGFNVGKYLEATARALNPLTLVKTGMDTRPEDVALGPAAALAPFIRQAVTGARGEAGKAVERAKAGRLSEAAGHAAAALLPVVGPSAAHAGEAIGAGDTDQGLAEATALLAPIGAAKIAPRVAPALATIGEQMVSKGKAVAPLAMKGAEFLPGVGGYVRGARQLSTMNDILQEMRAARKAAPEAVENAGGTLVKEKPPIVEQAVADAIQQVRKPEQPAKITTPPEPSLPPGYTPRTNVPKPKPVKMAAPEPPPIQAPTVEVKRPYFLRSPEEVAAIQARKAAKAEPVVPSDVADPASYPASWQSRLDTPAARTTRTNAGRATKAEVEQIAQTLTESGLSPREAIRQISKDATLAPETRTQLMTALGKLAKGKK